ncbi:MAG: transcriptional repressor [Planctomycetes bacterium]|nr:transcriptional repressor [Planctomycetota bacterium]
MRRDEAAALPRYPRPPVKTDPELRLVEEHLRRSGFRWTSQRALIVRTALGTHEHFTAEQLLQLCRRLDPDISRATVYRTLQVLEAAGFVAGLDAGSGGRRFEHVIGHADHEHMVCEACGAIVEFHEPGLARRLLGAAARAGFRVARHSLRVYGTCRDCARRGGGP